MSRWMGVDKQRSATDSPATANHVSGGRICLSICWVAWVSLQKACAIYLLFEKFAEVAGVRWLGVGSARAVAADDADAGAIGIDPDGIHSSAMGLSLVGADVVGVGLVGAGAAHVMCIGCCRIQFGLGLSVGSRSKAVRKKFEMSSISQRMLKSASYKCFLGVLDLFCS